MEFRILGPLEVVDGAGGRLSLPKGRARRLLAMLVVNAGEVVPTDRLLDDLWHGAPPSTADKALQGLISKLRKALTADADPETPLDAVIETRPPGYRLEVDAERIDAERFRLLVADAERLAAPRRAAALRRALDLWRGGALEEFAHEPFAQATIASLEESRLAVIERRVAAELAAGRHAEVTGDLEALLVEHPFREDLWAQLMVALYRSGRQVEALEAYKDARRTLVDELGLEPSPKLQRLERAILAHDPSLELDAPSGGDGATPVGSTAVGTAPSSGSWLEETRQVVTVVFAEIALRASGRSVPEGPDDAEATRPVLRRAHRLASDTVARHGGSVEGFIGGVLVAVFGVPDAREDDAWRAARAAVELRDELGTLEDDPSVDVSVVTRIGLNSGEVVLGEPGIGPAAAAGRTVNLAGKLQRAAAPGEVLLSAATRRLLGDAAQTEATEIERDGGEQLAWRLTDLRPDRPPLAADTEGPIVGREQELAALRELLATVVRERRAGLCTVVGEAGIGKSRLALQFTAGLGGDVRVLTGRCRTYGEGVTFGPLREVIGDAVGSELTVSALTSLTGGDDEEGVTAAHAVAAAIGMDIEGASSVPLLPALRALLAGLASQGPLVVVLEDIHWADPILLDLVQGLQQSLTGPILFLCLTRPELLEERRTWPTTGERILSLELGPLAREESELLLAGQLAGRSLGRGVPERIVELGQGNPLFLEQLAAATLEIRGTQPSSADIGVGAGEPMPVPTSLRMLLVARMMRLGPAERDVLRTAAVIGAGLATGLLATLVPETSQPFLTRHLEALVDRNFLRRVGQPAGRSVGNAPEYEFVHALVQQAAYHSLTHADRAQLHERIADRLVERDEPDELAGYHLERAHHEADLSGTPEAQVRALAVRAGTRLGHAGLRALARVDFGAAHNLLSRARGLLPTGHALRPEVLRRLVAASPAMGALESAETALGELLDELPRGATAERRSVRLERLRIRMVKGPDPWRHQAFLTVGTQVLADAVEADDHVAASQANYLLSFVHWRAGRIADLERTAAAAVRYAAMTGDMRELTGALWWPPKALVEGPTPVGEALMACEQLVAEHHHHPGVMTNIAELHAMAGEIDTARELSDQARKEFTERIHVKRALSYVALRRAYVEILAGELEAAEAVLRDIIDNALEVGERDMTAKVGAVLAWLTARRGAVEDAEQLLVLSEEHVPAQSVDAQARIAIARARLAIARGDGQAGLSTLRAALGKVPSDLLPLRAYLHVELGAALTTVGDTEGATDAFDHAGRLHERKGNVAGLRRLEESRMVRV